MEENRLDNRGEIAALKIKQPQISRFEERPEEEGFHKAEGYNSGVGWTSREITDEDTVKLPHLPAQ